jgi:hypothetical protein
MYLEPLLVINDFSLWGTGLVFDLHKSVDEILFVAIAW